MRSRSFVNFQLVSFEPEDGILGEKCFNTYIGVTILVFPGQDASKFH